MNRRKAIELSPQEQDEFLRDAKTIVLSSIDRRGYPHSIAMWYTVDAGCIWMTTYAKSQKVANIQRNPKVSLLAESGSTYDTLKGVLIRGRAELIHDVDACVHLLARIHGKMMGAMPTGIEEALKMQARKRVIVKVTPERVSSWDHSKLDGVY
ncbi:MAG TPA: pyridoxamine 5'-phosphate oxidase family protein [Candidatus Acidoferrales bacterium]|nr:pyridoxamine 5'-phosphate oxidase family protein [Candidatus Acidoferrales bacterium]